MEANYKLKTLSGESVRNVYQFFEWEALKHADANNIQANETFTFGNSKEKFTVLVNDSECIAIQREKNNKNIEAVKITVNQEKPNNKNNNNIRNMETKATPTATNEIEATLQKLSTLLLGQQQQTVNMKEIEAMIDAKIKAAKTVSITINDVPTFKTEKTLHKDFKEVLGWVSQNIPVYLFGPAGTGKNVLSEQVAEALNLPFYYAGCLQQKYELEGFINASGEYQETEFYKAFTAGGVFLFDEIDGTAAEVLIAFNAALANGYYNFPKHGKIKSHPNFRVIAAGNTTGRGANETYNGRFQLDASTLDRFAFVSLDYDKEIEIVSAGGDIELVEFAHELRKEINNQMLTYTVSTRALKRMSITTHIGMDMDKAMKQAICGGWAVEDITMLQNSLSDNGNKYNKIFKNLIF